MKKSTPKISLPLALKISAGINVALLATNSQAIANTPQFAQHSQSPAFTNHAQPFQAATGISPHFGGNTIIHAAASPLAGTIPLTQSAPINHQFNSRLNFSGVPGNLQHNFQPVTLPSIYSKEAVNLDLTSAKTSITVSSSIIAPGAAVTVSVGGQDKTFHTGDAITPAELVAIYQVQGGAQTITLDGRGKADGGTFSLNGVLSANTTVHVSGLVIPKHVTALDYISSDANFHLAGNLLNYGSIQDITSGGITSTNISALNIVNEKTGLITTVVQEGATGSANLSLTAAQNFYNFGGITGANNVTLQAPNIVNSGHISSTNGNITIGAGGNQDLNLNNTGGTFSALNGAINIREAAYTGAGNTNVTGGNFLSQQMNLNAGAGTANVNVDELTGVLSSTGNAVHVQASTNNLVLGKQCLSGDPTYYNTGNISIDGDITVSETLAIVAGGDITASKPTVTTIASNGSGQGQAITIIAGANIINATGTPTSKAPPGSNPNATISVTGPSGTGGNIDLTGAANGLTIDASGAGFNGGNVTLAAFTGSTAGTGKVLLPNGSTINTTATGSEVFPGSVTVIAGSPGGGTAIQLGSVTGGNLTVVNAQPTIVGGPLNFDITGTITQGAISADLSTRGASNIQFAGSAAGSGYTAQIVTGGTVSMPTSTAYDQVTVVADSGITLNGPITSLQGITLVTGGNIIAAGASSGTLKNTLPSNVVMVAGAKFNLSSTGTNVDQISVTGGSSLGGNIDLSGGSYSIDTSSNSGNNSGGNVVLAAFSGSKATNGFVNISGNITTNGDLNSANGNVEITAGTTATATAITVGNLNVGAAGTTAGTGNITLANAAPNVSTPVDLLFSTPSFGGSATTNKVGQVTTGTITMNGGNVTIQQGGNLNVPTAIAGTVNTYSVASDSDVTIAAGKTISGTTMFLAQALDAGTGSGNINVNGTINAATTVLLSKSDVNFGASSAITSAQGLTVVAARNILATGASVSISTDSGGNAGPLTMVAGALFSTSATQVTITGASNTGGSIDFKTSGSVSSFGSSALAGSGGNTMLAAFDNPGTPGTRGSIFMAGAPITAGGKTTSGSVTVIAGDNALSSIDIAGGVDVSKGTGGNIYIAATTPNASALSPVVINMSGGTTASGTFVGGAFAAKGSTFGIGPIKMNGGSLTVIQDLTIKTSTVLTTVSNAGFITMQSNGDIQVDADISAKGIQLMATNTISLFNNIISPQGITLIAGQDINAQLPVSLSASAIGNAGQINAIAGAIFKYDGTAATITGVDPNASLNLGIANVLAAQSSTASGGSITLVAGRTVTVNSTIVIKTDGATGSNGDVIIVSGNSSGSTAMSIGDIDITGGGIAGSGKIVLQAATPNVSSKSPLVLTAAKLTSGDPTGGPLVASDILTGNLRADAATIQVLSGENVVLGSVTTSNPSLANASGGKIDITVHGTEVLQIGGSKGISKNYIASLDASANGPSTLSQNGSITIANIHAGVFSNGGIQVQSNAISFMNGRSGSISLTAGSAVGDNIDLGTENTIDLSSTALTTTAAGGKISLIGNLITSTAPLTLRADSPNANSDGGSIVFRQANTAAYTINSSNILFDVIGGQNGKSGSIILENGGSISYSPTNAATALQFAANPAGGNGGSLIIKAGFFQDQPLATTTANLLISGALSANGVGNGKGGSVDLESNSTTTFNIGATTNNTNGVLGSISVAGSGGNGNITIVNNAGGVTNTVALTAVNQIAFTAGGAGDVAVGAALGTAVNPNNPSAPHTDTISLTAAGTGSITQTKTTNVIAANNVFLIAKSGSIGGNAVLAVNAPTLQALAGSKVGISDSAISVHLLDSQAGSTSAFTVTAGNNLTTSNITAGSVSITARLVTLAGDIKASNGTAGNVTITASGTDITSSQLEDTSASGSITLSAVNGTIEIGSLGSILAPSKITATSLNGIALTNVKAADAITLKSTGTGVNSTIVIANDLVATNSTSVVSLTANTVSGIIQIGGDLSAGKSVTVTAPSGFATFGTIGKTVAPSTVAITTSLGISSGDIKAGTSVTLKTTSTSNAGTPGAIQVGNISVSSATAGIIAITSNGIVNAIETGLLDASKSVTLTAARGEINSDKIGSLLAPGTVSLSALGFISTKDITAVTSVAIKTTAKAFPDGAIVIAGQVQATAAGKGTVAITSASVGGTGIDNQGDISGSTVTLTAAKAEIISNSIGAGVSTGKVVLSSLNGITITNGILATTSIAATTTGVGSPISINGNVIVSSSSTSGTIALTSPGTISSGVGSVIAARKSVTVTSSKGAINFDGTVGVVSSNLPTTITLKAFGNLNTGELEGSGAISVSTTGKGIGDTLLVNGPVKTTNGAVSIIASGSFLSVQDDVLAGSLSSTTKATVLLENSNKTSGYINISNANIATQGLGGGDVNIAIGAPAKGFNIVNPNPGLGPTHIQIDKSKSPSIDPFFGTPGAVDPTSAGQLIVEGKNIIFTSALANSIFFTNTKITADPPIGAASAAPVVAITSPALVATPTITVAPTQTTTATANLASANQISAPASVSLAALTNLGAITQATNYLQGHSTYRMISETEMDGGEVPVALLNGGSIDLGESADTGAAELTDTEHSQGASGSKTLSRGSVLVMPKTDTTIHTQFGDVSVAAKSVALVIAVRDGLAVFNIDDRKSDAVTITSAGKKLSVQPGTSAFIASEAVRSYEHVNPAQLISHRRMYEQKLGNGMKAFRSEIALPTVFSALRPLRAMVQSQDKETRDMAEHLLKTTSILMQLQSGGEDFKRIMKPQLTAYAQQ